MELSKSTLALQSSRKNSLWQCVQFLIFTEIHVSIEIISSISSRFSWRIILEMHKIFWVISRVFLFQTIISWNTIELKPGFYCKNIFWIEHHFLDPRSQTVMSNLQIQQGIRSIRLLMTVPFLLYPQFIICFH